jgi:hypothetical protein
MIQKSSALYLLLPSLGLVDPGNRQGREFVDNLRAELHAAASDFRDFTCTEGMRALKLLDPAATFRGTDDMVLVGEDPIHPTDMTYELLASLQIGS